MKTAHFAMLIFFALAVVAYLLGASLGATILAAAGVVCELAGWVALGVRKELGRRGE